MSGKKKQVGASNVDIRASLDADVEAFLKKGNKIQEIPSGISGQVTVPKKAPVVEKKAPAAEKKEPETKEPETKEPEAENKAT
ncbi:MAG: hypothetical protein ACJAX5_001190 [Patiriisocius sp.]|jgi:hypothetical protein